MTIYQTLPLVPNLTSGLFSRLRQRAQIHLNNLTQYNSAALSSDTMCYTENPWLFIVVSSIVVKDITEDTFLTIAWISLFQPVKVFVWMHFPPHCFLLISRQNMFSDFEHIKSLVQEPHLTQQQGEMLQTRELWGGHEQLLLKMTMLSFTKLVLIIIWFNQMWQLDSRKPPLYYTVGG